MNQEKRYQVVLPRARFAVTVGSMEFFGESEWVVKQAPPIVQWMIDISIRDITIWIHRNGGSIKKLRDSQARIVV